MEINVEDIYDTLLGVLIPEARVRRVENAFEPGKPCHEHYSDMMEAYERLRDRLGVVDEDEDVEIIINSLLDIERILCEKMFYYGIHYREYAE